MDDWKLFERERLWQSKADGAREQLKKGPTGSPKKKGRGGGDGRRAVDFYESLLKDVQERLLAKGYPLGTPATPAPKPCYKYQPRNDAAAYLGYEESLPSVVVYIKSCILKTDETSKDKKPETSVMLDPVTKLEEVEAAAGIPPKDRTKNELYKLNRVQVDVVGCTNDIEMDGISVKFIHFFYEGTGYVNDGTGHTFVKDLVHYHGLQRKEADKIYDLEEGFDILIQKLIECNAFTDAEKKVLGISIHNLHKGNPDYGKQRELIKELTDYQTESLYSDGVPVMFFFTKAKQ